MGWLTGFGTGYHFKKGGSALLRPGCSTRNRLSKCGPHP